MGKFEIWCFPKANVK